MYVLINAELGLYDFVADTISKEAELGATLEFDKKGRIYLNRKLIGNKFADAVTTHLATDAEIVYAKRCLGLES